MTKKKRLGEGNDLRFDPAAPPPPSARMHVNKRKSHRTRPCGNPPAAPATRVLSFTATEALTHLVFTAKMRWEEVTEDEQGHHTSIARYDVQLVATDVSGTPVDLQDSVAKLHSKVKPPPRRHGLKSATNPSGTTFRYVTRSPHHMAVGDKIHVTGCKPQLEYNNSVGAPWTVATIVDTVTFELNGGTTGIADCENPGEVREAEENDTKLHVIFKNIPRPKTWYWKGRVRAVDRDGCAGDYTAWTTPILPWTGADPKPPVPTFTDPGAVTFDRVNRDRHVKLRALFTFNEVTSFDYPGTPADDEDDVAAYVVQRDRSDDGITWDGPPYRTRYRPAKDGDADTTVTFISHGIRRRYWYRFRVRCVDRFHRKSDFSSWTTPALPFDDTQPPRPNLVTVFQKSADRIVVRWTNPTINVPTRGTVSGTSGTATVTGTGTKFTVEVEHGAGIKIGPNEYLVKRVISDTSLVLATNLSTSPSGATLYLVEDDPDIARSKAQIAKAADVDLGPTPDEWSAVYDSRKTRGEKAAFKIPDADRGETFYSRVQSIDAALNRSKFVPGTLAGNSDPDVNGDGIKVGRRHRISVTYTKNGTVVAKLYPQGWPCPDERYNIVGVRARVGAHDSGTHPADGCPTGSDMEINLRVRDDSATDVTVFTADNRLKIGAGTHKDTLWILENDAGFNRTYIDNGESLYMKVVSVGSTNPGEDLTVTVLLEPVG